MSIFAWAGDSQSTEPTWNGSSITKRLAFSDSHYLAQEADAIHKVISESKRFLAYEIIKRLKKKSKEDLLKILSLGIQENEPQKGKKHQVFRLSFDVKVLDEKGLERVLDYVHHNSVSGKWNLVEDYANYRYSSAGYYVLGKEPVYGLVDYRAY